MLIQEAIDLDVLRRLVPNQQRMEAIVARHTTPEQAAGIFSRVSPRMAVFSHSPGTAAIVEQTRRSYSGRVEMGEDLMAIDIVESEPEAPEGAWYKDSGSFKVCGEGEYPKTFLLRGQPARGQRL